MMIAERRRAERVRVNLDVVYANGTSHHKGTISDISVTGCFILAAGEAEVREPITVTIELPSRKVVHLTGEVVYNTPEIGFAMRFTELPAGTLNFIEKLVKRFSQTSKHPDPPAEQ
jgi:c-di-GMP-binding flagellar brake protein YcgR